MRSSASYPDSPFSTASSPNFEERKLREYEGLWYQFLLLCLVSVMQGADAGLISTVVRALEIDLQVSLQAAGKLIMAQALTSCLASMYWARLTDTAGVARMQLLGYAAIGWACMSLCQSSATSFWQLFALQFAKGFFHSGLNPISQSVISQLAPSDCRGRWFGGFSAAFLTGQGIVMSVVTRVSTERYLGMEGWRVAFACAACLSATSGALLLFCGQEPPPADRAAAAAGAQAARPSVREELRLLIGYMRIDTFQTVIAQGLAAQIPWGCLSFLPLLLQYNGIPNSHVACIVSFGVLGSLLGHILGGMIGDTMVKAVGYNGRPIAGQCSVFLSIPMIYLFLHPLSAQDGVPSWHYCSAVYFFFGLCSSWVGVSLVRPVLSDVVQEKHTARIIALDQTLEGMSGALLGAPMVGLLAERVFGYQASMVHVDQMQWNLRVHNCAALERAMLVMTVIPWMIQLVIQTRFYYTYAKDVALAGMDETQRLAFFAKEQQETNASAITLRGNTVAGMRKAPLSCSATQTEAGTFTAEV